MAFEQSFSFKTTYEACFSSIRFGRKTVEDLVVTINHYRFHIGAYRLNFFSLKEVLEYCKSRYFERRNNYNTIITRRMMPLELMARISHSPSATPKIYLKCLSTFDL